MPLGIASAASCIATPRCWTSRKPDSKSKAPAKTSAVYSPKLKTGHGFAGQRDVGLVGPQRFESGQAGDKQSRLTVDGRIEIFGRPLEAELRQVVAQDLGRHDRTIAGAPGSVAANCRPMPTCWAP